MFLELRVLLLKTIPALLDGDHLNVQYAQLFAQLRNKIGRCLPLFWSGLHCNQCDSRFQLFILVQQSPNGFIALLAPRFGSSLLQQWLDYFLWPSNSLLFFHDLARWRGVFDGIQNYANLCSNVRHKRRRHPAVPCNSRIAIALPLQVIKMHHDAFAQVFRRPSQAVVPVRAGGKKDSVAQSSVGDLALNGYLLNCLVGKVAVIAIGKVVVDAVKVGGHCGKLVPVAHVVCVLVNRLLRDFYPRLKALIQHQCVDV